MGFRKEIKDANRIVVKVGTSTLTYANGQINLGRIEKLTRVLADIVNSGKEVTLVSSGAVGVGIGKLKLKEKPTNIREKQALAAIGQCELMHIYSKFFGEYSHTVGQVLLTRDVIEDEHIKQNVCSTFELLLQKGIIPIVNENDTVSIDELENIAKFGDNDNLSAIVSVLIDADLLIILSDIDGFYDSNPKENPNAKLIKQIDEITFLPMPLTSCFRITFMIVSLTSHRETGGFLWLVYSNRAVTSTLTPAPCSRRPAPPR